MTGEWAPSALCKHPTITVTPQKIALARKSPTPAPPAWTEKSKDIQSQRKVPQQLAASHGCCATHVALAALNRTGGLSRFSPQWPRSGLEVELGDGGAHAWRSGAKLERPPFEAFSRQRPCLRTRCSFAVPPFTHGSSPWDPITWHWGGAPRVSSSVPCPCSITTCNRQGEPTKGFALLRSSERGASLDRSSPLQPWETLSSQARKLTDAVQPRLGTRDGAGVTRFLPGCSAIWLSQPAAPKRHLVYLGFWGSATHRGPMLKIKFP